jgi:hypothetical protein
MPDFVVHVADGGFGVGEHGPVLVTRFVGPPSTSQLRQVAAQHASLRGRVEGGKGCMLTMIIPSRSLEFDPDARRTSTQLLAEMGEHIISGAQVDSEGGFFGSIVRSIMSGVNLAARHRYPTGVFSSVDAAAAFTADHANRAGLGVDAAALAAAVTGFVVASP